MATFWLLQAADVWTTKKGLRYNCVRESNPLLPDVPHTDRLVIHKSVFLSPIARLQHQKKISNEAMMWPILFTGLVVYHNIRTINNVKNECELR